MYNFNFHRATTVDEAAKYLKADDAKLLAGGQTLLPTMKQRLAAPKHVIDIAGVTGLSSIEHKGGSLVIDPAGGGTKLRGGTLTIGALTRHAVVAESPEVQDANPA